MATECRWATAPPAVRLGDPPWRIRLDGNGFLHWVGDYAGGVPRDKAIILLSIACCMAWMSRRFGGRQMPISEMVFGVITTFVSVWFAGAMTALFYLR